MASPSVVRAHIPRAARCTRLPHRPRLDEPLGGSDSITMAASRVVGDNSRTIAIRTEECARRSERFSFTQLTACASCTRCGALFSNRGDVRKSRRLLTTLATRNPHRTATAIQRSSFTGGCHFRMIRARGDESRRVIMAKARVASHTAWQWHEARRSGADAGVDDTDHAIDCEGTGRKWDGRYRIACLILRQPLLVAGAAVS